MSVAEKGFLPFPDEATSVLLGGGLLRPKNKCALAATYIFLLPPLRALGEDCGVLIHIQPTDGGRCDKPAFAAAKDSDDRAESKSRGFGGPKQHNVKAMPEN